MKLSSILFGLATLLVAENAVAQSAPTFDQIVEGAKKEGKLTAWVLTPAKPETTKALIDAFNKRFGLDTQLEWVPNSPVTSNTRVIAEAAGGNVTVDIVGGGNEEEVNVALKAGIMKPYPWLEVFGAQFPALKTLEDKTFPDFKGVAIPYYQAVWGVGWNPNLIADADVPEKYTDFADPKWSGKFGHNSFFLSPQPMLTNVLGYDGTIALAKSIIDNHPVYSRGSAAASQDVSNGVVPFGIFLYNHAEQAKRANQPVKFKLFADYIPAAYGHLFVPDAAPHPNTARLFTAWFAAEGYKIAAEYEPISSPADTEGPLSKLMEERIAHGAKRTAFKTDQDLEASAKARAEITLMLSGQK
ncbi:extracellular solute-binding protein [Mesorhizobium sp. M7A.F.Ca.US.006.01.1.1]|uniref:ABC transporter substrate-binding protein n=1 Tax=Mesorhizobium sp. M7A.F.Ca.US.006.01.1.1 TaxID=2496707 RepID=UPI000FCC48AE|nr:ABC transporter substrate-binding protein [Mesorhizobium sp. M7A.F.Ca.US.006.01.1.1]RUZ72334.1 extracellular solute-binding protein [Mesorhizobium sp. M7A.F.Ca.US.006.01.1.1]